MLQQLFILLSLLCLTGACKKELPLKPTILNIQVLYQQTRQPVDSAKVAVLGTKGTYLTGRQLETFQQGYTDKQGNFKATMMIPRDFYTTYTVGKLVKIGDHYQAYSRSYSQPENSDEIKLEQENNIIAQLDTLK